MNLDPAEYHGRILALRAHLECACCSGDPVEKREALIATAEFIRDTMPHAEGIEDFLTELNEEKAAQMLETLTLGKK